MRIRVKASHSSSALDAVERQHQPLTFGVPLPRGAARGVDGWTVVDPSGERTPAQTRVLHQWPDGSARWVLVDARVHVPAGEDLPFEVDTDATTAALSFPAVVVAQDDRAVRVDTGAATFRVAPGPRVPFESVNEIGRAHV